MLATLPSTSGLRYRIARLAEPAGMIEKARPKKRTLRRDSTMGLHRLRCSFGTDVVRHLGIEAGRVALRHASVVTTQRYAKGSEHQVAAFVRELWRGA